MTELTAWLMPVAIVLIPLAWIFVLVWYVAFSVLLLPFRLLRRGARKRKREALMHRERLGIGEPQ